MSIYKRLLKAILNCGVDVWKLFDYSDKRDAILEVTPYDYNVKYSMFFLKSQTIYPITQEHSISVSFDYSLKGKYTDYGVAFMIENTIYSVKNNRFVPIIAQPYLLNDALSGKSVAISPRRLFDNLSPISILKEGNQDELKDCKVVIDWNTLFELKSNCDKVIDELEITPLIAVKFNKDIPLIDFNLVLEE